MRKSKTSSKQVRILAQISAGTWLFRRWDAKGAPGASYWENMQVITFERNYLIKCQVGTWNSKPEKLYSNLHARSPLVSDRNHFSGWWFWNFFVFQPLLSNHLIQWSYVLCVKCCMYYAAQSMRRTVSNNIDLHILYPRNCMQYILSNVYVSGLLLRRKRPCTV